MLRCHCGGFIPTGITRCPNCQALHVRPSKSMLAAAALAGQLITACACYGGPPTMLPCAFTLPDGGDPTLDPTNACFTGTLPVDGGTDGGTDAGTDGGTDGG